MRSNHAVIVCFFLMTSLWAKNDQDLPPRVTIEAIPAYGKSLPVRYKISDKMLSVYKEMVLLADKVRVSEVELNLMLALEDAGSVLSKAEIERKRALYGIIESQKEKLKLFSAELWHVRFQSSDLVQLNNKILSDMDTFLRKDPEAEALIRSLQLDRKGKEFGKKNYADIARMLESLLGIVAGAEWEHVRREAYEDQLSNHSAHNQKEIKEAKEISSNQN